MSEYVDDGEYKIIMRLRDIPEFTIVTKPTGRKAYEVKHNLPIYAKDEALRKELDINVPSWCIYLVSEGGVNVELPESQVAVHFDSFDEMVEFVNELEANRVD